MSDQDEICSDIFQTWSGVSTNTVVLHFGSDTCQNKLGFAQVKAKYVQKINTSYPTASYVSSHMYAKQKQPGAVKRVQSRINTITEYDW